MKTKHLMAATIALCASGLLFTATATATATAAHYADSANSSADTRATAGAATVSHAELKAQVDRSERAFAATMKNRDYAALGQYLAEDAIFFGEEGTLHGRDAILKAWQKYYEGKQAPFSWGPDQVEVLASGKLAYSGGTVLDPTGKPISRFSSIWRLEAPGRWKIILDRPEPLPNNAAP